MWTERERQRTATIIITPERRQRQRSRRNAQYVVFFGLYIYITLLFTKESTWTELLVRTPTNGHHHHHTRTTTTTGVDAQSPQVRLFCIYINLLMIIYKRVYVNGTSRQNANERLPPSSHQNDDNGMGRGVIPPCTSGFYFVFLCNLYISAT
jgi:hypothetical protein